MSSVLKSKGKKMEPAGYSKVELLKMCDGAKNQITTKALFEEVFKNVRLITYQILHDKYEFEQKHIIQLENTINTYLDSVVKGKITIDELDFYLKEKCNIVVKNEANRIPFNERFALTHLKISPNSRQHAGMFILTTIYNYFVLLGVCLKTQFGFSRAKILNVYEWIRYYITTLSRPKQFDLKIENIAEDMMVEINYCDERFINQAE